MSAHAWHRDGDPFTPRSVLTLHTMRVEVVRGRAAWYVTCRQCAIDDSPIEGGPGLNIESAESAALAIVRERIGTMAEEMAGVDL